MLKTQMIGLSMWLVIIGKEGHLSCSLLELTANHGRMGLYGWSSAVDEDMDANVGLHDGIAAVEWTNKYISRFGGDPDNITVMGESAGGTMIALMLVAEGLELPFQKVTMDTPKHSGETHHAYRPRH